MATTCTVTATITDPSQTNLLGNAFIKFRLRNFTGFVPQVAGTSIIVEDTIDAYPNPAGVISQVLTCNTAISPVNTFYTCEMWNQGRIVSSANYIFNGNTSLNTAGNLNPAPAPYAPYGILFENNGAPNSSQYVLNLESTDGTVAITDVGGGTLNLQSTGSSFGTSGDGGFWGPGIVLDDFAMFTLAGSDTTLSPTSGLVFGYQFVLESKWTISRCSTYLSVTSFNGQNFSFGIYNASGNLVVDSGAFICVSNLPAADTVLTNTFVPVTLGPGTYYFVQSTWTLHNLTCSVNALGATNNITAQVYNANALRTVVATNTYNGTSLPATLGTLTGVLGGIGLVNCAAPFWEP
jgi:hypothetical protein